MAKDNLSLWYDEEGDFLEVIWTVKEGYFTATADDRVMVKVDQGGQVLGFHILGLRSTTGQPVELNLSPVHKVDKVD